MDSLPPKADAAEKALLSCVLQSAAECLPIARARLRDESPFYDARHRTIFRACCKLADTGAKVDLVGVLTILERWQKMVDAGGDEYLSECYTAVETCVRCTEYCEAIMDAHILRCLASAASAVEAGAYGADPDASAGKQVDAALARIAAIHALRRPPARPTMADFAERMLARVLAARRGEFHPTPWHIKFLDENIPLMPARFAVVGARPGIGKTATALSCALRQAMGGVVPGIMCFEMLGDELLQRAVSQLSGLPFPFISKGLPGVSDVGWQRFMDATDYAKRLNWHYLAAERVTLAQVEQQAREWVQDKGVRCIFIDYLQQIKPASERPDKRLQIAAISTGLRDLALTLQVPIVAMSQLNRQAAGERPQLWHLSESTQLEMDADYIVLLHRPDYDGGDEAHRNQVMIDVAKNRHGPMGNALDNFYSHIACIGDAPILPERTAHIPPVPPPRDITAPQPPDETKEF